MPDRDLPGALTPEALARQQEMFANRLRRNHRRLHSAMEQASIGAYRLFDRDIPEIRAVVDRYEDQLVVAEYSRSQTETVDDWVGAMADAAAEALELPRHHVRAKSRHTGRGVRYDAPGSGRGREFPVRERDLRFLVDLDAHLDTGLFADHRETRARVRAEAEGRRVLNLFAYTGSFSCAAARGGAAAVTTVDLSNTYLAWARRNLELNGLMGPSQELVRRDAVAYLEHARRRRRQWDLCVVDPPSFSTRGGVGSFDVRRDHVQLLRAVLDVTAPGGVVYFSTNHQRFGPRLDELADETAEIVEITEQTVPPDFRNRGVHRCWRIVR
jgi:23S rRNA (cytosine1962-C5)-methyltransferase